MPAGAGWYGSGSEFLTKCQRSRVFWWLRMWSDSCQPTAVITTENYIPPSPIEAMTAALSYLMHHYSYRNQDRVFLLLPFNGDCIFQKSGITGWRRNYRVKWHPGFVFLNKKLAIFVDGCFWYGHDCRNTRPRIIKSIGRKSESEMFSMTEE